MIPTDFLKQVAIPFALARTKSRFWEAYLEMVELDQQNDAELISRGGARLKEILHHAYAKVPYYRELMDQAGIRPGEVQQPEDLQKLPITTKSAIQKNFPDRITDESMERDELRFVSTGGTAQKLIAIHDFKKRDMARAATMRSLSLAGGYEIGNTMVEIPPSACDLFCSEEGRDDTSVFQHVLQMIRQRKLADKEAFRDLRGKIESQWFFRNTIYPPLAAASTEVSPAEIDQCIERLREDRPFLLKALPTYLQIIARRIKSTGATPIEIPVIKPMGASVNPEMRVEIESAFTGQFREEYGSSELGGIACDCEQANGLHVFADLFHVEVVKHQGRPAEPGELGRIVVTDLVNRAMPLIRYQIGDVGRLETKPCPCGRTTPRVIVEGRLEDTIVTADGRMITNDLLGDMACQFGVDFFQLIEKKIGRFELKVVAKTRGIGEGFAQAVELLVGKPDFFRVKLVNGIKPEPGGKFRFIKSSSYENVGTVSYSLPAPQFQGVWQNAIS